MHASLSAIVSWTNLRNQIKNLGANTLVTCHRFAVVDGLAWYICPSCSYLEIDLPVQVIFVVASIIVLRVKSGLGVHESSSIQNPVTPHE